jgi:hypothetical protein
MDPLTNTLMQPTDELLWKQEGLFDLADSLEKRCPPPPPESLSNCPYTSTVTNADTVFSPPTSFPALKSHTLTPDRPPLIGPNKALISNTHRASSLPHREASIGRKQWKINRKTKRLVLGDDVGLENLCKMSVCALVGRISYKSLNPQPLEDWMKTNWLPLLGYCPEVLYLKKGWLSFLCRDPEDATKLLSSLWVFGGSSLMLKRWRMAFNPESDFFQLRHLWVLLPGLPLHFWTEGAIKAIGDSLGRFIAFDHSSLTGSSRKLGKVLVEMDLSVGLPANLEIEWRGRKTLQTLDYLGLPFRCNKCRETGHLHKSCPGKSSTSLSEEADLLLNPPDYVDVDPSLETVFTHPGPPSPPLPGQPEPLSTKLFNLCPSLYNSLTASEMVTINRYPWLAPIPSGAPSPDFELSQTSASKHKLLSSPLTRFPSPP